MKESPFDEFWTIYPRHVGKIAAQKAYSKALTRATVDKIREGAKRFAENCRGKEEQFIAHPATWLNAGRWDDEALPAVAPAQATRLHQNYGRLVGNLNNERYQRTMTDEYSFGRKPTGRFRKVDEKQKKSWEMLATKK